MKSIKIKSLYRKGLLILGLLVATLGCSDALELDPKTTWAAENFYKNKTEINAALAGIHSSLSSGNTFGGVLQQMSSGTDEDYKLKSWNENIPTSIMAHNPASGEVQLLYQNFYQGINNCNNFIKYISPDNFEEEEEFNKYLGEAKFLRAFMYYHLTIWYNEVPLRLEPSVDQNSNHVAPSPVEDIYLQIIEDMTFAAEHLPGSFDSDYVAGHANSMAAHAMLAKTYLKAAGYPLRATEINGRNPYEAAKEHCAVVMNEGNHGLNADYKELFLNYIQNRFDLSETLFEIVYRNGTDLGLNIGGRIGYSNGLHIGINGSRVGEPFASPEISPSPIHDEIYEEGDKRKTWNTPSYNGAKNKNFPNGKVNELHALQWGYTIGKFRRWDAIYPDDIERTNASATPIITLETPQPINQNITGINFPVLRFSDVLLMFAEASNELDGPTGEAIAAVDLVRNRAGLENLGSVKPDAIAGKGAFFEEIVDERLRELCFEGHRKMDLIRWGLLEEKLTELYESIIYHPNYTPASAFRYRCYTNFDPSKHLSLPYPQQEVLINNLLEQKPEW
ncbi:RagB/SusD family nutrient uptake outer membrane protein [Lutimonas saemankumensis]|uniref:RagB/SusD family nutrient uptake outer membrane protein n=1 Tax=Lutimonas saemankumensis TaxID=483016 RepID=UPI001CD7B3C3|nr:RagB/SusD family nutrient uptake outer membrane protein [Lutimonas saemankumensis]MCA0932470.1 RagB/SusD family nutrient uptake outer membrane protein [Lutimonas saemankumensis]